MMLSLVYQSTFWRYYYEQLSISIPQLNTTTEMQFAEAVAFEDAKIITFLTTRFCH